MCKTTPAQIKRSSAMKKWLKALGKAIQENQQKRADYRILQMLSDKELNDLGIGRSQIKEVIYGEKPH